MSNNHAPIVPFLLPIKSNIGLRLQITLHENEDIYQGNPQLYRQAVHRGNKYIHRYDKK